MTLPQSIKVAFVLAILVAAPLHGVYAQENDSGEQTLLIASQWYTNAQFEEVIDTINACIKKKCFYTVSQKISANKLLAYSYIETDQIALAEKAVKSIYRVAPDYSPNQAEESVSFMQMVNANRPNTFYSFDDAMVTTASRSSQRVSDAPATAYVITHDQIQLRGYRSILDLLEDIPEIELQKNSISEFKNQVSFRGIEGMEKFMILLDGVRITPPTGDPYSLSHNYSLADALRVEVILGPASALYGVDAFDGIINIITVNNSSQKGIRASSSYGRFNTTDQSLVVADQVGALSFSLAGHLYHSNEAPLNQYFPVEYAWFNDEYVNNGTALGSNLEPVVVTPAEEITSNIEVPHTTYYLHGRLKFANFQLGASQSFVKHSSSTSVDPSNTVYRDNVFLAYKNQAVYLAHDYKYVTLPLSIKTQVTYNNYEMDTESNFTNIFTSYDVGYKYQYSRSLSFENNLSYDLTDRIVLLGGVIFQRYSALPKTADLPEPYSRRSPAANQDQFYLGTNDIVDGLGENQAVFQDFYYLNYQNLGSYLQGQYKTENGNAEFTLGIRYDKNSRYGGAVNPRLGVVFKPKSTVKMKLLYGESFVAPSPWVAYQHFGSFQLNSENSALVSPFFHLPNPDLKPQKLRSLEGSIQYSFNTNLVVVMNGYVNRINNLIDFQGGKFANDFFKGIPVDTVEEAINSGDATTYGATARVNYLWQWAKGNANVYGAYTYTNGRSDGQELSLTAPHTLKMGIDLSYGLLGASVRYLYRDATNSVISNTDTEANNPFATNDPFGVVNAAISFKPVLFGKVPFMVRVIGHNLLDNRYYHVGAGNDSFSRTPQDPVRWEVSLGINTFK